MSEVIISEYWSDDRSRHAEVVKVDDVLAVRFYKDGKQGATEFYPTHNLQYHEDAAENYVLGVKNID